MKIGGDRRQELGPDDDPVPLMLHRGPATAAGYTAGVMVGTGLGGTTGLFGGGIPGLYVGALVGAQLVGPLLAVLGYTVGSACESEPGVKAWRLVRSAQKTVREMSQAGYEAIQPAREHPASGPATSRNLGETHALRLSLARDQMQQPFPAPFEWSQLAPLLESSRTLDLPSAVLKIQHSGPLRVERTSPQEPVQVLLFAAPVDDGHVMLFAYNPQGPPLSPDAKDLRVGVTFSQGKKRWPVTVIVPKPDLRERAS